MKNRAITGPDNFGQIPDLAERGRARVRSYFKVLASLARWPNLPGFYGIFPFL